MAVVVLVTVATVVAPPRVVAVTTAPAQFALMNRNSRMQINLDCNWS